MVLRHDAFYNNNLFIILISVHSLPTEELLIFIKLSITSN